MIDLPQKAVLIVGVGGAAVKHQGYAPHSAPGSAHWAAPE